MRPRAWSTTSTCRPARPRSAPTGRRSWRRSTRRCRLEVGERPQSIAAMARAAAGARAQARSRAPQSRPRARAPAHRAIRLAARSRRQAAQRQHRAAAAQADPSLVPAPPDAPQPKGQLLDFIDALEEAPAGARRQEEVPPAAAPQRSPPAPEPARPAPTALFGLGYGPPPERRPRGRVPSAARRAADAGERQAPVPAVLARRRAAAPAPRARPGACRRGDGARCLYRLLIGARHRRRSPSPIRTRLPQIEGRGASVVSSQATDLAPTTRITGHKRRGHGARHGRPGALDRVGRCRRHAQGVERRAPARSCAPSSSTKAPATALAVDDRRALTGHKGGAIVLWDLERAEKLAVFQHQQAPDLRARLHRRRRPLRRCAARPAPSPLFDIRTPSAPAAVFDGQDGAQAIASCALVAGCWRRPARTAASACGAPTRTASRAAGATRAEASSALDMAPGGRTRRQRQHERLGASVVHLVLAPAALVQGARGPRHLASRSRPTTACSPSAGEDGQVKLWDLRSGRRRASFRGHAGPVHSVAFSADGRRLISAGQDGTIRVWSTAAATVAGAGVTRRRTLPSISWLASRLKRRSRGSRPDDIASVSGRCRPGRLSHRRA